VIVHDFDVVSVTVAPDKTNPVLIIDADAMLTLPVASERFKTISWKNNQVAKLMCRVQLLELSLRHPRDALEPTTAAADKEKLCFPIAKRPNHQTGVYNVRR